MSIHFAGSGANNIEQSGILLTEKEMNTEINTEMNSEINTEMNTGINTEMNTKIKSEIKSEIKTEIGEDIKVKQEDSLEKSHGFICTVCSAHFLHESYFLEHIKEHHSVDHNIQTAEKPKKKFRCPRIKTYRCTRCSYHSNNKCDLNKHNIIVHAGLKPLHKCSYCPFACLWKVNITRHERIHTGNKPFSCKECSYTASRADHLKEHAQKHRNEKPFKCAVCGNKYVSKRDCAKHMRQKHPEMTADSASEPFDWLTKRQVTLKDDASSDKDNPGQIYQQSIADSPSEKRVPRTKQSEEKPYKCSGNQHVVRDRYVLRNAI